MLPCLPEGIELPETKHQNILSNARQFLLGLKDQMIVCLFVFVRSLFRHNAANVISQYKTLVNILFLEWDFSSSIHLFYNLLLKN